jgi:putative ABC transport system permease protein
MEPAISICPIWRRQAMGSGLTISRLALRNLTRRPGRTLLTIAGVALAIMAFVALIGLARGLETALRSSLDTRGTDIVLTERGAVDLVSSIVPDLLAEQVAGVEGVAAASPELTRLTALPDGESVPLVAWPPDSYLWSTLEVAEGRLPDPSGRFEVALGTRLAEEMNLKPGDRIILYDQPFRVSGVIESRSMLNRNLTFALLGDVQELTFREGQSTTIHVSLDAGLSPEDREAVLARLRERFREFTVDPADQFSRGNAGARIADALSWSISIVAVVIAIMNVLNTLGMAVNERRHEIAIMRAVGWPNRRILVSVMIEGLALCLVGGAIGAVAGYYGAWAIAEAPMIRGFFEPSINLALIAYAALVTLLVGALGSIIPALRATSVEPAEILRGH